MPSYRLPAGRLLVRGLAACFLSDKPFSFIFRDDLLRSTLAVLSSRFSHLKSRLLLTAQALLSLQGGRVHSVRAFCSCWEISMPRHFKSEAGGSLAVESHQKNRGVYRHRE